MRISVVGAAGQVGAAVFRRLAARTDLSVFGITRNEFAAAPLRYEGLEVRVGSISDPADCERLLQSSDLVVNAALHLGLPQAARAQNRAIVRNLLERSAGARVVHFSSVAVYGSCLDLSYSTFERPRGDGTYAREKLNLERFALSVAARARRRLAILRLGHVYGPGQGYSKEMITQSKARQWELPFDGSLPSNAVHVHRLADSIPRLAGSLEGSAILNAVDAPQSTWRELYDLHSEVANLPRTRGMPVATSTALRTQHRAQVRRTTVGRLSFAVARWLRRLPFRELVDANGVREAMDLAMLHFPRGFEDLIRRRYQRFATKHRISTESSVPVPSWYFSDAVPGPNLLEEVSGEPLEHLRRLEKEELSAWYSTFAAPAWLQTHDERAVRATRAPHT